MKKQNKQILNEENPLVKYKRGTKKEWKEISSETGVSVTTLIRIATKSKEQINYVSYGSVIKINDTIGVHLVNDWSN